MLGYLCAVLITAAGCQRTDDELLLGERPAQNSFFFLSTTITALPPTSIRTTCVQNPFPLPNISFYFHVHVGTCPSLFKRKKGVALHRSSVILLKNFSNSDSADTPVGSLNSLRSSVPGSKKVNVKRVCYYGVSEGA